MTDHTDHTVVLPTAADNQLSAMLGAGLSCAGCRYNLGGLSISSVCPECGLPIQVSILAVVDPHADSLSPLVRPRLIAISLHAWMLGGLCATLIVLWLRLSEFVVGLLGTSSFSRLMLPTPPKYAAEIAAFGAGVCAVAIFGFVRPIKHTPMRSSVGATVGAVLMVCAAAGVWYVLGVIDRHHPAPFVSFATSSPERPIARFVIGSCIACALLGVRTNLRLLAARSLLFRQGRADRQTIYMLVAVLTVAMVGDVLQLASFSVSNATGDILWNGGRYIIAFSSVIFVVGVCAVSVDVIHVSRAVLSRPIRAQEIVQREAVGGP